MALRCFRRTGDVSDSARLKLYRAEDPIPLSDVLPILENMGLKVEVCDTIMNCSEDKIRLAKAAIEFARAIK